MNYSNSGRGNPQSLPPPAPSWGAAESGHQTWRSTGSRQSIPPNPRYIVNLNTLVYMMAIFSVRQATSSSEYGSSYVSSSSVPEYR